MGEGQTLAGRHRRWSQPEWILSNDARDRQWTMTRLVVLKPAAATCVFTNVIHHTNLRTAVGRELDGCT